MTGVQTVLFRSVLDLAASPLGYDISRIDSFSGWLDARAGQSYSIFFKAVGSSEFTQITPGGSGNDAVSVAASGQSLVTLSLMTARTFWAREWV